MVLCILATTNKTTMPGGFTLHITSNGSNQYKCIIVKGGKSCAIIIKKKKAAVVVIF